MKITIKDQHLQAAALQGMDEFIALLVQHIATAAGGEMNAQAFQRLTPDQITLWAYSIFRDEICDGGCIQLIHNGYGDFFFLNPFAKAMRLWGLKDFSKLIYKMRELYEKHGDELKQPCTDEEFMALYEKYPEFEDVDDEFIEKEEEITAAIAYYLDEHLHDFIEISHEEKKSEG